jgi:glucose/mannose transport system substrate-binding protein
MRRTTLIAAMAAAGLALAACGGGGDEGSGGSAGSGDSKDVEVFTWWASGSEKAGLDALVGVFSDQHPDYTFVNGAVAGGAGSNAKNVLASRLQQGDPPDTFQAHAGAELADYIRAGQIEDVSDLYEKEGWKDVFPQDLVDLLTVDGKIYSVPANVHRANVVWANPAVLQEAGIDPATPPEDLDEWMADLQKVKATGKTPLSIATDWTQVQLLETVLLADLGTEGYTGLWTGDTDWKSSDVTDALNDYKTLLDMTNADRQNLDWPDATQQVIDGAAAYNVMGDWAEAAFAEQNLKLGTDYVAFPVPGTGGTFDFLADSFTLPKGAPNPEGTKAWLNTVGSAEGQLAFNKAKGSIPARTDADAADYGDYQKSALESFANDTVVPSLAHGAAVPIGWLTDITTAISQFSSQGDVEQLQSQLADAAQSNIQD